MKLSAQEEYGLRCILSLARAEVGASSERDVAAVPAPAPPEVFLTINDIAQLEGISSQYAGKLIRLLGKAGLVTSVRGCKGGYRLSRAPESIHVAEVLEALGSKIYDPDHCERFRGDRDLCVHSSDCSVRAMWTGIQMIVDHLLTRTTLAELVRPEEPMASWFERHAGDLGRHLEHGRDLTGGSDLPGSIQIENFTGAS